MSKDLHTIWRYELTQGTGGGGEPSYLLKLNGGLSLVYPKKKYNKSKFVKDALNVISDAIDFTDRNMTIKINL